MRIGIVTPAYNAAATIAAALNSLLTQSWQDWVVLVVDDGSTDGTAAIVRGFRDRRIQLIRQANAGVSAARNAGITAIQSDALLFLDADDWLAPHALSALAAALAAAPLAVAAVGPYSRVRPDGQAAETAHPALSGNVLERLLTTNLFANGGHMLLRRQAVAAIGLFRTDLRYGEDWEYWVRLAFHGPLIAASSPDPVCFIRERADGAYGRMASDPASYGPCMEAIYGNPDLTRLLGPKRLAALRQHALAESHWSIGRELVRHGQTAEGRAWLRRSVAARPTLRRLVILAATSCLNRMPTGWAGRFSLYLRPRPRPRGKNPPVRSGSMLLR